jgi:hypothetical protein
MNTLAYYNTKSNLAVKCCLDHGLYTQHFIFFLAYGWAQRARVLYLTRLERLAGDKHSSLLQYEIIVVCKKL